MLSLSLGVALCFLIIIEYIRYLILYLFWGVLFRYWRHSLMTRCYCRYYDIKEPITDYFDQFLDSRYDDQATWSKRFLGIWPIVNTALIFRSFTRDKSRGLAVTHLYLLIGCAIPLWTTHIVDNMAGSQLIKSNILQNSVFPHLGWLTIGIGDSFVSFCI